MEIIILIAAGWRITRAVHRERIGQIIRGLFGAVELEGSISYPDTILGALFQCFWCLSFWISCICVVMWTLYPPIVYPFAISTGAIVIEEVLGWLDQTREQ